MKQYFDYLVDLYNGVNYIRNSSNEDIYDILESTYIQKMALLQISNYGVVDIKKIISADCLNDTMPFIDSCKESPIPDSVGKLRIIFSIIGDKLGFSYSDFELITGSIIIKNHCYNQNNLELGTTLKSVFNDKTPFFSLEDIYKITKIKYDVIKKYMEVFCENIKNLNSNNIYKIIQTECGYILIFSEKFYYYSFTYLEQYIIENNLVEKEYYYYKRGENFEFYVKKMFESFFPDHKFYSNLNYYANNKKMEIDLLIDLGDSYLIVEDKSTIHLDKKVIESKEDFEKLTINAYKKGMNSLDSAFNYMNSFDIIKFGNLTLKKKRVYSLLISLRKNYYASGEIQKICYRSNFKHVSPLYHVSDLADILFTINNCSEINLKKGFLDYLDKRCEIINEYKFITADIDEIDLFGIITSPDYYERVRVYMESFNNKKIEFTFMDSKGHYREIVNDELNNVYLSNLIEKYFRFLI